MIYWLKRNSGSIKINIVTEDNVIDNFIGKTITVKNKNNNEKYMYTLKENEKSYSINNLEFGNEYNITIDELNDNYYIFDIPEQDVVIDKENNEITLQYNYQRMYLYKEGDICEKITGGYERYSMVYPTSKNQGYGTATIGQDGGLTISRTSGDNYSYGTTNAIDTTKFSKIYIDGILTTSKNNSTARFAYNKIGGTINWDFIAQNFGFHNIHTNPVTNNYPLNVRTNLGFDLTTYTGNTYMLFSVYQDVFKVYNVYLEK